MAAAKKAAEANVPDVGSSQPAGGSDNQAPASPRPEPAKKAATPKQSPAEQSAARQRAAQRVARERVKRNAERVRKGRPAKK